MAFTPGRALSNGLRLAVHDAPRLFGAGAVVMAPVFVLLAQADLGEFAPPRAVEDEAGDLAWQPDLLRLAIGWILATIGKGLVAAAVAALVVARLRGGRASLPAALRGAFARFPALAPVAVAVGLCLGLMTVAVAVGTSQANTFALLLIVPTVLLACIWYVALPACALEEVGVGGALGRSDHLTRGRRGAVFLLVVFESVSVAALALALEATCRALPRIGCLLASHAVQLLVLVVGSTIMAVAYHDLRTEKEGTKAEELAGVFA